MTTKWLEVIRFRNEWLTFHLRSGRSSAITSSNICEKGPWPGKMEQSMSNSILPTENSPRSWQSAAIWTHRTSREVIFNSGCRSQRRESNSPARWQVLNRSACIFLSSQVFVCTRLNAQIVDDMLLDRHNRRLQVVWDVEVFEIEVYRLFSLTANAIRCSHV